MLFNPTQYQEPIVGYRKYVYPSPMKERNMEISR
jgi:hypothetical protein